jgi:hypothetical protein
MSNFAARFAASLEPMYRLHGDAAIFSDRNNNHCECTVIVDRDLNQFGDTVDVAGKTALISVRKTEISNQPRRGEKFTLTETGEVFLVDSGLRSDEDEFQVFAA